MDDKVGCGADACVEEPCCDITGNCFGILEARSDEVCSCTCCGKELHFHKGFWWTWDVIDQVIAGFRDNALPQFEVSSK